jgi:hypothetical protein
LFFITTVNLLCCVRKQFTGILGIQLASCDSMYLTQDNCPAPERIHNDIRGVRTYYALWEMYLYFYEARDMNCTSGYTAPSIV